MKSPLPPAHRCYRQSRSPAKSVPAAAWLIGLLFASTAWPAELRLLLPLNRTAYQDNEWIYLAAVRTDAAALPAGDLMLKFIGEDGSRVGFTFAVKSVEAGPGGARAVEHLQVNGWLLRPGRYTVEVAGGGAQASTNLTVHSQVRQSDFKLINWGRAKGKDQLAQGEENLGFNLFYGHYGADDEANFIRAGVDFMANCVMSGGHQMDLRTECDWSDPYVIRGGTRRVVRRAFLDRTRPNVCGVHFYDEPGLTWEKDAETGEATPHAVTWQHRSFSAAFGAEPPNWKQLDPHDPAQAARWAHWARWKLGFMDAAWQDAQFGLRAVQPEYVSVTQSQYGYSAFTDGYYFNVVRSLPVISGHGGYHDWGPGYFNPSMFLEFARARDLSRPNWYLPTWYGSTTADEFRLEQYLSFQCNIQGLISPPDLELGGAPEKSKAAQGIVESNHLLARLGPVFNTLPVTRPPVALLFSLSQMIHTQTLDRKKNYAHDLPHGRGVMFAYLAGKLLQHQFLPVLDEDILDGTLAAHHKAILLTSLDYLDAPMVTALEHFVRAGGLVLCTADTTVNIKGAIPLAVAPGWPESEKIAALKQAGKTKEAGELQRLRQALAGARPLANALRPHLERAGIQPPLSSSEPGIAVTRQAAGDLEYLLAVNATHDPDGNPMLGLKAAVARLGLAEDGRPVYDAVHGGLEQGFKRQGRRLEGEFRFGPGQMRVFARIARPIGGVKAATPILRRDYTKSPAPLELEVNATVLDQHGGVLSGSIPLRIRLTDPLGFRRYELFRATDGGALRLRLPLALNDPAGTWIVAVAELLSHTEDTRPFTLEPTPPCAVMAGATWRAVHWPEDRARIFRFFRQHHHITLVNGGSDYNPSAAERLEKILQPWNVTCATLAAAEANHARPLTEDEARTWIGLDYAGRGQIKPGATNRPGQAGFALRGPAILLGTPEDNPLIKFMADQKFLPYKPAKGEMPGPGRGYVAWQREALGVNQESIVLLAYDAQGMSEAVGTLYEMLAGLEPLTPLAPPRASEILPASQARVLPEPAVEWSVVLPDRVTGLKAEGGKIRALTHAGLLIELGSGGKVARQEEVAGPAYAPRLAELNAAPVPASLAEAHRFAPPNRLVKLALAEGDRLAVAYWGGVLEVFDRNGQPLARRRFDQDVTALAWNGPRLLVGDADGWIRSLRVK